MYKGSRNKEESVDLCLKDNVYVVRMCDNCTSTQNGYVRTPVRTRCFVCVLPDLVLLVMEAVYSLKTNVKPIQREPIVPPSPARVLCFEASVHVQASICRVAFCQPAQHGRTSSTFACVLYVLT